MEACTKAQPANSWMPASGGKEIVQSGDKAAEETDQEAAE
jgi:hypothetical protein